MFETIIIMWLVAFMAINGAYYESPASEAEGAPPFILDSGHDRARPSPFSAGGETSREDAEPDSPDLDSGRGLNQGGRDADGEKTPPLTGPDDARLRHTAEELFPLLAASDWPAGGELIAGRLPPAETDLVEDSRYSPPACVEVGTEQDPRDYYAFVLSAFGRNRACVRDPADPERLACPAPLPPDGKLAFPGGRFEPAPGSSMYCRFIRSA